MAAYTDFLPDTPVIASNGDVVINNTRNNLMALRDGVVAGVMPGWNYTHSGGTDEEPTEIIYKNGVEWVRLAITWSVNNPTVIVYSYSANSGTLYHPMGTITNTYNGNGTLTGSTWS